MMYLFFLAQNRYVRPPRGAVVVWSSIKLHSGMTAHTIKMHRMEGYTIINLGSTVLFQSGIKCDDVSLNNSSIFQNGIRFLWS